MGKSAVAIDLTAAERRELEVLARRRKTAHGLARRARIVLAAADGLENKATVERVGADVNTVGKWRRRFAERRLDGLYDEPWPGAPRQIGDEEIGECPMKCVCGRCAIRFRSRLAIFLRTGYQTG